MYGNWKENQKTNSILFWRYVKHKLQICETQTPNSNASIRCATGPFGARGAADRGVESLRFQVSIVRI